MLISLISIAVPVDNSIIRLNSFLDRLLMKMEKYVWGGGAWVIMKIKSVVVFECLLFTSKLITDVTTLVTIPNTLFTQIYKYLPFVIQ